MFLMGDFFCYLLGWEFGGKSGLMQVARGFCSHRGLRGDTEGHRGKLKV